MKNTVKTIVCVAMALLMMWGVWSWWGVVSSNTPTSNRELSKYNFFVLLTDSQEEEEVESERKDCAYIECTTDVSVLFCTSDGELWELRVAEPADWNINEDYVITFDTMETADREDDRIVAVSILEELKSYG